MKVINDILSSEALQNENTLQRIENTFKGFVILDVI